MLEKNLFIISLHILRQLIGPFILIMISLIGIIWLAQSLKFIELIVVKGLSFDLFLNLTILIIPKLTASIIPFVGYLASLISFHRMSSESEIIAFKSAGISNFKLILAPSIFALTLIFITFALDSFMAPSALNKFKNLQNDIREKYISTLFQEKVFSSPANGLTVFVREIDKSGTLKGILIHDSRNPKKTYTVIADSAKIEKTLEGPYFLAINGNRQEINYDNLNVSLLYFDEYSYGIKNIEANDEKRFRESSERKTSELFFPREDLSKLHKREFLAEAHQRLISLIVIFAMILLGAITFLIGEFDRKMSFKKLAFSISTAVLLQLYLVATNPLIIKSIELVPLLYIIPIVIIIIFLLLLFDRKINIFNSHIMREN